MDTLIDLETVLVELEDQFRPYIERKYLVHSCAIKNAKTVTSQYPNLTCLGKSAQGPGQVRPTRTLSSKYTRTVQFCLIFVSKNVMFVTYICQKLKILTNSVASMK